MIKLQLLRRQAIALTALVVLAGTIATSGALAGRYSTVSPCPAYRLGQPFLPWLDPGSYFLMPGGTFESGAPGWSLSGGAHVVAGNESYYLNSPNDSHSLSLPAGSSATSPSVCVTLLSPDARLFARNTGSPLSLLKVTLNYTNTSGNPKTATVALLPAGHSWAPSLPILFLLDSITPIVGSNGQTWVSFTLTPTGSGAAWQIDDSYVDPLKNH